MPGVEEVKNKHASSKFKNVVVLDGVEWNTNVLAKTKELSRSMARKKLADFAKGLITKEELLKYGHVKKKPVFKKGKPTEEWQNMKRKERTVEFTPGSWERDHIKDRYQETKKSKCARADKKPQIKRRKKG